MSLFSRHAAGDWCHVCGLRLDFDLVDVRYPTNAEHAGGEERYVRICEGCVLCMMLVISTGKKMTRQFVRHANQMKIEPMPRVDL